MSIATKTQCLPSLTAPRSRSVLSLFSLARQRRALAQLDEVRLKDLGLSVQDAQAEARRPFWDVPAFWR